jgi:spermidine synthase
MAVAAFLLFQFSEVRHERRSLLALIGCSAAVLLMGFVFSERIMSYSESLAFQERVIYSKSTPYQRIVLTRNSHELKLFLNGNLQFSSRDEYRYHEALVHVGLSKIPHAKNVLLMGGGDGLAVREVLKYPSVQSITLVDLDKQMTDLFSTQKFFTHAIILLMGN